MGIIAKLYVNGQVYNVLESEQGIIQSSDETGRPTSRPFHTGLKAAIESTKDTYFFEKAIHPTQQIQEIILEYSDSMPGRRTRRIRFVDCYVTFDSIHFKANDTDPLTETLLITAAGIEDSHSQGKYTTPRQETEFLSNQAPLTTQEEETEKKKVIDYYITDLNNKRIDKILAGNIILLNIHSKNMTDELFTIKLSNKTIDFKYNGEVLTDDTLSNYRIGSNHEKIELEVIKQEV
ncbi:hypothetical protein ATE84_0896 [Aquimarina sp. MAR_2010_214]|uniref:type VI secretion system tube protein TssD n=1 Tax=Aquimarina sp. MAR_2010_214 TaxID=1250026 RepID=UPI000C7127FE|nr:type VI secretion system tube protein TssD [Aquimarina sp. MAR_2010_214]PKV48880.1 hypothetical protein ATE84_0896 [Aquimarina sp. MAR_2010_214]